MGEAYTRLLKIGARIKSGVSLQEGDKLYREFDQLYGEISGVVNLILDPATPPQPNVRSLTNYLLSVRDTRGKDQALKLIAKGRGIKDFLNIGHQLSKFILEHKVIPKSKAKKLEKVLRTFISARQAPRNLEAWLQKNSPGIQVMLEAKGWPNKEDQPDREDLKFNVGPFTVHNVVGLEEDKLESTKKTIESAVKFLNKSRVPGAKRLLYGPVMVVGKLQQPRTLAWYYPSDDTVYMRPHLKLSKSDVHNLIHELGHRYWARIANREAKIAWLAHHRSIKNQGDAEDVSMEDVEKSPMMESLKGLQEGDVFPIRVQGMIRGGSPRVVRIVTRGGEPIYHLESPSGKKAVISKRSLAQFAAGKEREKKRRQNYPTGYSATDPEEHFSEAFAMYSMGKLPIEHKEAFERIWMS